MRIETLKSNLPVQVTSSNECIELGIGEPSAAESCVTALSIPQAEMVLHTLGLEIAQIKERQRLDADQRTSLAQVVLDTEVRLRP